MKEKNAELAAENAELKKQLETRGSEINVACKKRDETATKLSRAECALTDCEGRLNDLRTKVNITCLPGVIKTSRPVTYVYTSRLKL